MINNYHKTYNYIIKFAENIDKKIKCSGNIHIQ